MTQEPISELRSFEPVTRQTDDPAASQGEAPVQNDSSDRSVATGAPTIDTVRGQAYPAELALSLVLNEIVEQARSITGATGATLVLACGGQNRFHAGATASEVDSYLQKSSGLLDRFLSTGIVLRCEDTEKDARFDAGASRRLGVRSLIIVPARRTGGDLVGFIEAFSSRTNAFGEHEVQWLSALGRRIVHNLEVVEQNSAGSPAMANHASGKSFYRANLVTSIRMSPTIANGRALYWASLAAAILITFLIGYGLSGIREKQLSAMAQQHDAVRPPSSSIPNQLGNSVPAQEDPGSSAPDAAGRGSETTTPRVQEGNSKEKRPIGAEKERASALKAVPGEGLTLYENKKAFSGTQAPVQTTPRAMPDGRPDNVPSMAGIKISRIPLPQSQDRSRPLVLSEQAALANLIQRIEPKMPGAGEFKSGAVKIAATVDENGAVTSVKPVSGDPQLVLAAAHALRHWRFKPLVQDGQPLKFESLFTIQFTR